MIDTHSHLFAEEFENDLDECIKRAKENNIEKIILVGFSYETNAKAYELANKHDIFLPTAGIHPSEVDSNYQEYLVYLDKYLSEHKVYAVGECGLDYYWDVTYKEEQKIVFYEQCKLAIKYDLPIIVHMREATQDAYEILKQFKGKLRGVMHCYSGSYEMAIEFLKLGLYISLGGPVTFKNARVPKEIALKIDIDKLLIETDCPYLAPTPYRGKRNESSYVKYVCEEIAKIRGLSLEEVDRITTSNAKRLFKF
jgi:TatD DNase family protein